MPYVQGQDNNHFLTNDVIAKEAQMVLENELVACSLFHNGYKKEFSGASRGDKISIRKPQRVNGTTGRKLTDADIQRISNEVVTLEVNHQDNVLLSFTNNDRRLSIDDFSRNFIKPAMTRLAEMSDSNGVLELIKLGVAISNRLGDAANPNHITPVQRSIRYAGALMTSMAIPNDGLRQALLNPFTCAAMDMEVANLGNNSNATEAYAKGYMKTVNGINFYENNNLATHTVGEYAGSTPLVDGASQKGDTLVTDGWQAGAAVLNKGDIFSIDGIQAINPDNHKSIGRLMQFVVLEDVVADGSGSAEIKIYPSINDGTVTVKNFEGDDVSRAAYKNVSQALDDNAAITVFGDSGATYDQDFLFHKHAVAYVPIEMHKPESASFCKSVTARSGVSVRMWAQADIMNDSQIYRFDTLYALKNIRNELGVRMYDGLSQDVSDLKV